MQSTAVIACYGALHLDKIALFNATNIKVLCTDSTTLLFTRYFELKDFEQDFNLKSFILWSLVLES